MTMSRYPDGFATGVSIRGVPLVQTHPGRVFWVSNSSVLMPGEKSASNGNKGTFLEPFSTIQYAVSQCLAGRGDIIFVRPGHVETVATAGALDLSVSGIAVIGLGSGSLRPTVNVTAATADMQITANDVTLVNFLITGGIDAITGILVVSGADAKLMNVEVKDVTGQVTDGIVTTATADRLLIDGFYHNGAAAAGSNSAIAIVGGTGIVIRNFRINGNFAVSAIDVRTTATTDIDISTGYIWNKNASDICIKDTITASTGKIGPDLFFMLTDNAANITEAITGATFHQFGDIKVCNLAGEIAMEINTTASTDA